MTHKSPLLIHLRLQLAACSGAPKVSGALGLPIDLLPIRWVLVGKRHVRKRLSTIRKRGGAGRGLLPAAVLLALLESLPHKIAVCQPKGQRDVWETRRCHQRLHSRRAHPHDADFYVPAGQQPLCRTLPCSRFGRPQTGQSWRSPLRADFHSRCRRSHRALFQKNSLSIASRSTNRGCRCWLRVRRGRCLTSGVCVMEWNFSARRFAIRWKAFVREGFEGLLGARIFVPLEGKAAQMSRRPSRAQKPLPAGRVSARQEDRSGGTNARRLAGIAGAGALIASALRRRGVRA